MELSQLGFQGRQQMRMRQCNRHCKLGLGSSFPTSWKSRTQTIRPTLAKHLQWNRITGIWIDIRSKIYWSEAEKILHLTGPKPIHLVPKYCFCQYLCSRCSNQKNRTDCIFFMSVFDSLSCIIFKFRFLPKK